MPNLIDANSEVWNEIQDGLNSIATTFLVGKMVSTLSGFYMLRFLRLRSLQFTEYA